MSDLLSAYYHVDADTTLILDKELEPQPLLDDERDAINGHDDDGYGWDQP